VETVELRGDGHLETVVIRDRRRASNGSCIRGPVFVFIGLSPNTSLVNGLVDLDGRGFIVTDAGLQTSLPGVFAAGDARAGSTKQAASAAGEGAAAAISIRSYLEPLAGGRPCVPTPGPAMMAV